MRNTKLHGMCKLFTITLNNTVQTPIRLASSDINMCGHLYTPGTHGCMWVREITVRWKTNSLQAQEEDISAWLQIISWWSTNITAYLSSKDNCTHHHRQWSRYFAELKGVSLFPGCMRHLDPTNVTDLHWPGMAYQGWNTTWSPLCCGLAGGLDQMCGLRLQT